MWIWIESGLAWIPFLMQRLDSRISDAHDSEAHLLKRRPSDYMRDMFYTSQPLETSNLELTEATMKAMNAENQLLFSSDWPHWDFNPPNSNRQSALSSTRSQEVLATSSASTRRSCSISKCRREQLASIPGVYLLPQAQPNEGVWTRCN